MKDTDYKGKDKWLHLIVVFLISIVSPQAAIGAAFGKEYGDYKEVGNHWCWWDILADMIGLILGTIVHYLIFKRIY